MKPDYQFLLVIAFAVIVKQLLSPFHNLWRATTTSIAAVFCAYVFTDPICGLFGWDNDKNRLAVAAVLGLTGEHIIRHIIDTGKDPDRGLGRTVNVVGKVFEIITVWRSGGPQKPGKDEGDAK